MKIDEIFDDFFGEYKQVENKDKLSYVVTSRFRTGNPKVSSHAIDGNAMDFTLRTSGNFAGMNEYRNLFKYIMDKWPFRAGIDNTDKVTVEGKHPNVHIHVDLGMTVKPEELPQFFIEDNGALVKYITDKSDV